LKGFLPARVEGQGDSKTFTVRVQEDNASAPRDVQYSLFKDARGVLRVTAPNIVPRDRRRK
jgi:hypothetical protein